MSAGDPLTSTRAAARLLQENYRILGSWPLAITAYNHGTAGIFRAIDSVGSRDLVELIRRYQAPAFGFASKNFYAEFLAVVEIVAQREKHFPFLRLHSPVALREVEVKKATTVEALLKPAAISRGDFFQWNPALADGTKSNSGRLPGETACGKNPAVLDGAITRERNSDKLPCSRRAQGRCRICGCSTHSQVCGE